MVSALCTLTSISHGQKRSRQDKTHYKNSRGCMTLVVLNMRILYIIYSLSQLMYSYSLLASIDRCLCCLMCFRHVFPAHTAHYILWLYCPDSKQVSVKLYRLHWVEAHTWVPNRQNTTENWSTIILTKYCCWMFKLVN